MTRKRAFTPESRELCLGLGLVVVQRDPGSRGRHGAAAAEAAYPASVASRATFPLQVFSGCCQVAFGWRSFILFVINLSIYFGITVAHMPNCDELT